MKPLLPIVFALLFPAILAAEEIVIKGIDFENAKSIKMILDSANQLRGSQKVVLQLDETRSLKIIESTACHFAYLIDTSDRIQGTQSDESLTKEAFLERLKEFVKTARKAGYNSCPIKLVFSTKVTGKEGHQLLRDIVDTGITVIIMPRAKTGEQRQQDQALEQERTRRPKPAPPY